MKISCATCGHVHSAGERCEFCNCAGATLEHPQGKRPLEERYDPKEDAKFHEGIHPYTGQPVVPEEDLQAEDE